MTEISAMGQSQEEPTREQRNEQRENKKQKETEEEEQIASNQPIQGRCRRGK